MTALKSVKWQLLIMTGLGTYIFLIAITIPYMWYYSQFSDTGHDMPYYTERANQMVPALILCLGPFVFYIASRWLCGRVGQAFYLHGILLFLTQEVIDLMLTAFSGHLMEFLTQPELYIVYSTKLLGALAGSYFASKAHKPVMQPQ